MSYYQGKSLERKVVEFGLEGLDEILRDFIENPAGWPGDIKLSPGDPADVDMFRITLYSLLHKYGLKEEFSIRQLPAYRSILLTRKVLRKRAGAIMVVGSSAADGSSGYAGTLTPEQAEAEHQAVMDIFKD